MEIRRRIVKMATAAMAVAVAGALASGPAQAATGQAETAGVRTGPEIRIHNELLGGCLENGLVPEDDHEVRVGSKCVDGDFWYQIWYATSRDPSALENKATKYCLAAFKAPYWDAVGMSCGIGQPTAWEAKWPTANGRYHLKNIQTGYCLTAANDRTVKIRLCVKSSRAQQWYHYRV